MNENLIYEYFSRSQKKWVNFEEMDGEYLKNVVRKVLREDSSLPVRLTYVDENGIPEQGELLLLTTINPSSNI
tara:strand:+ start:3412 stop:3630 length:219 start_codon:yes stop_codon:yes gene_type:complete